MLVAVSEGFWSRERVRMNVGRRAIREVDEARRYIREVGR
jgi:hypothetical protein